MEDYPQQRVLYAVDESQCLDASTQKGTVLAIVECSSYGRGPLSSFGIVNNPTSNGEEVYTYHTSTFTNASDSAQVQLVYVTFNSNYAHELQVNAMEVTISCSWGTTDTSWCACKAEYNGCTWIRASVCPCELVSTIRYKFCNTGQALARPYFLNVPQERTLQIPLHHPSDHYALFNVYKTVSYSRCTCTADHHCECR